MLNEAVWGSRVVFFGEADHGKSSLIGYLYAESQKVDMDRHKRELLMELGNEYKDDFIYSSLINPIVVETQGGLQRFSSKRRHLRDFAVEGQGDPILITMIDTPGHTQYLRHQEYGATRGKIGVLCLYIGNVLDDNFDGSFVERRTMLWFAAHPNRKLIIALTQFDRMDYSENAYIMASQKLKACLNPEKIKGIIPIALNFNRISGENILSPSAQMPWYKGATLINAIREQWYEIANEQYNQFLLPKNLVFSIEREYPRPLSSAGKIWRIYIENGALAVGDAIKLTSVEVKDDVKSTTSAVIPFVSAVVKEFRMDVCIDDDDNGEDVVAYTGSAITINIKDCYAGRDKIKKALISTTDHSIGLANDEPVSFVNRFCLRFESPEDVLWLRSAKQEIVLLIFGRGISAKITSISDDEKEIFVELLSDNKIAIPDNKSLRDHEIFKRIIVRIPDGVDRVQDGGGYRDEPRYAYLPAMMDLDIL